MPATVTGAAFRPHSGQLHGAADFVGPGGVETPRYQPEIFDMVRREYPGWMRMCTGSNAQPATGHPTRYFEQTAIAQGSFTNPRQITATRVAPTRVERFAAVKAISAQLTYGQFDVDLARQQGGAFEKVQAKDLIDTIKGVSLTAANALWNGTDTSLVAPTTTQFVGGLTQITQTATIAQGASIEDGILAEVAAMSALLGYQVKPTAVYASPEALNLLVQELKASQRYNDEKVEVTAGFLVRSIMTQAGELPLIPDPSLAKSTVGNTTHYPIVVVTEPAVEYHYVGPSEAPRVFELGLLANLAQQRVIVQFGVPIFKGPSYAHSVITLVR